MCSAGASAPYAHGIIESSGNWHRRDIIRPVVLVIKVSGLHGTDQTELLRNANHALLSPLNSILNLTDSLLLGIDGAMSAAVRQSVADLQTDALRLRTNLAVLVEWLRFENTGQNCQITDIRQLVSKPLRASEHARSNIQWAGDTTAALPPVCVDAEITRNVIANLLAYINQVASPEQIRVEVKSDADTVIIRFAVECSSSANAIAADVKDDLSLHLLLCDRLIRSQNGELSVSTSEDHKLNVDLSLPIYDTATADQSHINIPPEN